jgi:hypothetical protein
VALGGVTSNYAAAVHRYFISGEFGLPKRNGLATRNDAGRDDVREQRTVKDVTRAQCQIHRRDRYVIGPQGGGDMIAGEHSAHGRFNPLHQLGVRLVRLMLNWDPTGRGFKLYVGCFGVRRNEAEQSGTGVINIFGDQTNARFACCEETLAHHSTQEQRSGSRCTTGERRINMEAPSDLCDLIHHRVGHLSHDL